MRLSPAFRSLCIRLLAFTLALALGCSFAVAQTTSEPKPATAAPQKVIFDTDIGDDIDDVYALALALSSPELDILGVTTAWGDTELRARMVDRVLCETGRTSIPVFAGVKTTTQNVFSQARWAQAFPAKTHGDGVAFILDQARKYPGEVTLIAVAPFTNVGAAITRDPEAFRKLKRVVIMGGSINRGYGDIGYWPDHGADPEYNAATDVAASRKLFASGVPLFVMPLDSTQLALDEVKRQMIFEHSTPLTDALALLTIQWGKQTPTLFDPVAVGYAISPGLCPMQPMHIEVDDKGFTRATSGPANAQVCLRSNPDQFFHFYLARILKQNLKGHCAE